MNELLRRMLETKDHYEEGERYREFSAKWGRFEVHHERAHYEMHDGVACSKPEHVGDLSIRPYFGQWLIVTWHLLTRDCMPAYLPWAYDSAEAACAAMLTISDALLDE